jgi:hypothetical protein
MRLNAARVEQTLSQFESQVIPDSHPAIGQLKNLFGDHTFFLAANGLNILEPLKGIDSGKEAAKVVNLADWTDESGTSLAPHEPEATEVIVEFVSNGGPSTTH